MLNYEAWDNRRLIDRIYELESEVEGLKSSNSLDKIALVSEAFATTRIQSRLVIALSDGRVKSSRSLFDAAYFDAAQEPCDRGIDSHIHRLARKLGRLGIGIIRHHGVGVQIPDPSLIVAVMSGTTAPASVGAPPRHGDRVGQTIDFIRSIADADGHARFVSSDMTEACQLIGEVSPLLARIQKKNLIKIISRPTKRSPKTRWHIVLRNGL